ncbi:hypothetical protein B0H13DRAFT_1992539 [Mycena leptocephala]|nr:hypothetical protein B0H13DRAFT_1992539 [Mycena leptocephala]
MHNSYLWLVSTASLLLAAGTVWQKFCKSPAPWIEDLRSLGRPRKRKLPGTAIICGGSIAGIVTARICADHFERVVVVDPDVQDADKPKTRILQYDSAHAFLSLFLDGARQLWPNFDAELQAIGGGTRPADIRLHYPDCQFLPHTTIIPRPVARQLIYRRSMVQTLLHRLLLHHPTTSITSIQSVTVRKLDGAQVTMDMSQSLRVKDCTGVTQAGFKWLKAAGFPLADDIRVSYNPNLRYVTVTYDSHANTLGVYMYLPHDDIQSCFISLLKTDNDKIVPFIAEFRGLKMPIPSWVVETIEILCEEGNPSFDNVKLGDLSYVQYNRVPQGALPSNFGAFGDASLQLNPIHGQGFAKAMMNGIALNSLLHSVDSEFHPNGLPTDFSARYFKNSATTSMDGETSETGSFFRWFETRLLSAATTDEEVASASPDKALFAPTVLWKVLGSRSKF